MRSLSLVLLLLGATPALGVPMTIQHQARMHDAVGNALDGPHDVTFTLYDAPAGGTNLWTEAHTAVPFDDGYMSVDLGVSTTLTDAALADGDVYLTVSVDGGPELAPRLKLNSVPFAIRAGTAELAEVAEVAESVQDGAVIDASELRVNGTTVIDGSGNLVAPTTGTLSGLSCGASEVPVYDGTDWGCGPALAAHTHNASDIDQGVLSVDRLPVGQGNTDVAAGDHVHALTELTGVLDAAQMPVDPVDLAPASTMDGLDLATAQDVTDAFDAVPRNWYTGTIVVDGDADTYYPVCVNRASDAAQLVCDLQVHRRYNWQAPDTWNTSTHRGGLAFWLQTHCGSAWSGQPRSARVRWFEQTYSTMLAKYSLPVQSCHATCVYLRGGGARYDFAGNFPGVETPVAYLDPSGTRDMCGNVGPPYNPPLEVPVTTTSLGTVDMND